MNVAAIADPGYCFFVKFKDEATNYWNGVYCSKYSDSDFGLAIKDIRRPASHWESDHLTLRGQAGEDRLLKTGKYRYLITQVRCPAWYGFFDQATHVIAESPSDTPALSPHDEEAKVLFSMRADINAKGTRFTRDDLTGWGHELADTLRFRQLLQAPEIEKTIITRAIADYIITHGHYNPCPELLSDVKEQWLAYRDKEFIDSVLATLSREIADWPEEARQFRFRLRESALFFIDAATCGASLSYLPSPSMGGTSMHRLKISDSIVRSAPLYSLITSITVGSVGHADFPSDVPTRTKQAFLDVSTEYDLLAYLEHWIWPFNMTSSDQALWVPSLFEHLNCLEASKISEITRYPLLPDRIAIPEGVEAPGFARTIDPVWIDNHGLTYSFLNELGICPFVESHLHSIIGELEGTLRWQYWANQSEALKWQLLGEFMLRALYRQILPPERSRRVLEAAG